MSTAALCLTTAGDVAGSGLAALLFAGLGALWVLLLERTGGMFGRQDYWRGRWVRRWNWGVLALVGIGGAIALVVALFLAVTDTVIHC